MSPVDEKFATIKTRAFRVFDSDDVEKIVSNLVFENLTGKVIINMSQGGLVSLIVEEKLKPPA
jgi:hypothetical protein